MMVWNYILIGLGLGLLVFLSWKEVRRTNRAYLSARVIATVLAVGALVCMGLPMSCQRGVLAVGDREGVLLTEGWNADSVQRFFREHEGAAVVSAGARGRVVSASDALMKRWHVFGYGLEKEEWVRMRPPELVFHPSPVKMGVVAMDWRRRLVKGERLQVQGHWMGGTARLFLEGMGRVLDSVPVRGDSLFVLHTVPAQAGRAVYRFIAVAGRDTVEQENIPVEVVAGKPMNILVLASSPAAENTFLLNWLAAGGHRVASRTLVSTDKYKEVFANRTALSLGQVTPGLLGEFDIVIADALTLSRGLWPMMQRQVERQGLRLVMQMDSAGGAALGVASGGIIKGRPGMRLLLRDSAGRVQVGVVREGAGEIVYTNQTTYPMLLAGEQERYAVFWSSVLRKDVMGQEWRWEPALPRVQEPVKMMVQTGGEEMPQGVIGGAAGRPVNVYLGADGVLPFFWSGRYWPEMAGWQTARTLQGDTTWWYAWAAGAWMPLRREQRRRETEAFIRERGEGRAVDGAGVGGRGASGVVQERRTADGRGWFYALFLVSIIFLWIEKKIL